MAPKARFYQPTITRLPSLLCLLFASLALIGVTEYACRHLPALDNDGLIAIATTTNRFKAGKRQVTYVSQALSSTAVPTATPSQGVYIPLDESSTSAAAYFPLDCAVLATLPHSSSGLENSLMAGGAAYLPVGLNVAFGTPTTAYQTAAVTNYLPIITTASSVYVPLTSVTSTLDESVYLPVEVNAAFGTQSTAYQTAAVTDYLSVATTTTSPSAYQTAAVTEDLPITTTTTSPSVFQTPVATSYTPINFTTPTTSFSVPTSVYLPLSTVTFQTPITTSIAGASTTSLLGGLITQPSATPSRDLITNNTAEPTLSGVIDGVTYSLDHGVLYIDGSSFFTAVPTTATLDNHEILKIDPAGAISLQSASAEVSGGKPNVTDQILGVTSQQYFIGAFLPTILAVLFTIPCHLLASALQEMEPFYQLQRLSGSSASGSILLNYKASITAISTLNALRRGHFLVLWSGLISLVVLVLAPLASGTVFIGFIGQGVCTATSGRSACIPRLGVYPAAARAVQGILSLVAVLTLALAIAMPRKKSGVYANPLSIASVATLFQNRYLIEQVRRLDPYSADLRSLRMALEGQWYRIGPYEEYHGNHAYGLMVCQSSGNSYDADERTQVRGGKTYASVAVTAVDERTPPRDRTRSKTTSKILLIHPLCIALFGLIVAGLEVLVLYYNRTGGDTAFERFMDSASFGVIFLFTIVGVGVKMYWRLLDDEIRAREPYRQLLNRGASAGHSILLAPHSNPFTGWLYSLRTGHLFNAYVSFVAVLCEPLIVALANIAFKPGLALMAYRVCTYFTIAVLSFMLIGIAWMLCRGRTPGLVKQRPNNMVDLLIALCGSHMLEDFSGLSTLACKDRDAIIKAWGKEYSMGALVGIDGVERTGIDEDAFIGHERRSNSGLGV